MTTLFVRVLPDDGTAWTEEMMENLARTLDAALPPGVDDLVVMDANIETMDRDEVEGLAEQLVEALEN